MHIGSFGCYISTPSLGDSDITGEDCSAAPRELGELGEKDRSAPLFCTAWQHAAKPSHYSCNVGGRFRTALYKFCLLSEGV